MVYVEYVIVNNLIANSVILLWTAKVAGFVRSKKRIIGVALIGTLFGVLFPTVKVSEFICVLLKFGTALILTFLITGRTRVKRFFVSLLIFYGISFCVGGAVSALISAPAFVEKGYTEEELTFCITAGGVIFIYIARQTLSYIKGRADKGCVTVYLKGRGEQNVSIDGFVDSGNEVSFHGVGVSFIPFSLKERIECASLNEYISVFSTVGHKIFEVYTVPYLRYSDGREEDKDVPVIFWKSDKKQERVILHLKRS